MVVDRAGRVGGQRADLRDRLRRSTTGCEVDVGDGERLGLDGADDHRAHRAEGDAHRRRRHVDGEAARRGGDDHRVAHADLGVALPTVEHRDGDRGDQLAGLQHRALRAERERGERHVTRAAQRFEVHHRVEGRQHRQTVARRRRRPDVAADRRGMTDLRRADGARRLRQRRQQRGQRFAHHLGVGDAGAEANGSRRGIVAPRAQFADARHGHDVDRLAVTHVHLDHHVRAAGDHERVRFVGQRGERVAKRGGRNARHRPPTLRFVNRSDRRWAHSSHAVDVRSGNAPAELQRC